MWSITSFLPWSFVFLCRFLMCFLPLFSQAIINSTITPNMTFTKTSQKFGQWADSRANTVYGLGFSTEQQLQQVSTRTLRQTLIYIERGRMVNYWEGENIKTTAVCLSLSICSLQSSLRRWKRRHVWPERNPRRGTSWPTPVSTSRLHRWTTNVPYWTSYRLTLMLFC